MVTLTRNEALAQIRDRLSAWADDAERHMRSLPDSETTLYENQWRNYLALIELVDIAKREA